MKSKITFSVVGNESELQEFVKLCGLIQSFGTYGMGRTIEVAVDGDGSGTLRFFSEKDEEMPNINYKLLQQMDANKTGFRVDIGE